MNNANEAENILDISEKEFQDKVLEKSSSCLVLVDFWAPWCGPCKQLTPILEKIINSCKGEVRLVKINIDENQQIASQLNIQSIPAVYAFKNKQPVDVFQGVIPEKKIIEFIEKNLGQKISKDHTNFYKNIKFLNSEKRYDEAVSLLSQFVADYPEEILGLSLYVDCLVDLSKFDDAEIFYKTLSEDVLKNDLIISAYKKLEIKKNNQDGPSIKELESALKAKPKDLKIIFTLADKYFAENLLDNSFNLLLENYQNNKDKVKEKMISFFEILGNTHEKTIEYRKKFSQIMFV